MTTHAYPQFYACYLLKSVQTPKSTSTYIGSTPNPLRRIRQHNGEISQGAWKTSRKRPWVMHMLVHGFPSKQAALQFEWAWQHSHISRHLKGKAVKGHTLVQHVKNLHTMVATHPYDVQALRIVLFTETAVKIWGKLPASIASSSTVLGGPAALDIHTQMTAPLCPTISRCAVCSDDLQPDTLSVAACPACSTPSHLTCLASIFLRDEGKSHRMIPRGGTCWHCSRYNLWGDLIKGIFSRLGTTAIMEDDDKEGEMDMEDAAVDDEEPTNRKRQTSTREPIGDLLPSPSKRECPPSIPKKTIGRPRKAVPPMVVSKTKPHDSSDAEAFDFGGIDSNPELDDSSDEPRARSTMPKERGRLKFTSLKGYLDKPFIANITPKEKVQRKSDTSGEDFDFGGIDSNPELDSSPSAPRHKAPFKEKVSRRSEDLSDCMNALSVS